MIVALDKIEPAQRGLVGRKAHGLAELIAGRFPVPRGFCLTRQAFEEFLPRAGVDPAALPAAADEAALAAVRAKIRATALPDALAAALLEAHRTLCGGEPVAVRSSSTHEDMSGASFAGLYDSVLGVTGGTALLDAVRACWASVYTPRVWEYCIKHAIPPSAIRMAVVVQVLVPADVAGVMFTMNPFNGMDDEVIVEACRGLGDALVSGKVDPDRYVLSFRNGGLISSHFKDVQPMVDADRLAELVRLGVGVQARYGVPQDIEWAYRNGRFWLVQTRPVTRYAFGPELGEWTTADLRDGGVSSSVCSPFMASLYEHALGGSLPAYIRSLRLLSDATDGMRWARVHFARLYWNLGAVKKCLARVPGFVERNFDSDLGIEIRYEGDGVRVPVTVMGVLRAIPTILALRRVYKNRLRANAAHRREFEALEARYRALDLAALTFDELCERYRELVDRAYYRTESAYFDTIYNCSNAKLDFKVALDALNERAAAAGEPPFSLLKLLSGLTDLRHSLPLHALWEIAGPIAADPVLARQVREARPGELPALLDPLLTDFIQEFGYHSTRELDITVPRWSEDPSFVYRTLQGIVAGHDPERDPRALNRRQQQLYLDECQRIRTFMAGSPFRRWRFFRLLERARRFCWWREEMRDRSTRMYALIRHVTMELARRLVVRGDLDMPDSIWFLNFTEVRAMTQGQLTGGRAERIVAVNRMYVDGYRNFACPNEISPRWRKSTAPPPAPGKSAEGMGCSPGVAEGTVRVISGIHEAHRIERGDVLVTRFTDPGWTPLLGLVGAVVTETGGLLSHAAVIAREYGIPAVLAVPGATARFADGQRVRVDGTRGLVECLD